MHNIFVILVGIGAYFKIKQQQNNINDIELLCVIPTTADLCVWPSMSIMYINVYYVFDH